MSDTHDELRNAIIKAMRTVHDPEIPVNIYDLGLIYTLSIGDAGVVDVEMTLTAPNCPVADKIPAQVGDAVRSVEGVTEANVKLVWEPAWSPELMTEVAQFELESMGIDPRRAKEAFTGGPTRLTIGRRPTE